MKTPFAPFLHLICTALAAALLLVLSASAGDLAVRVIDRSPDVRNLDTTDTLKWYADESIDYTVRPRRGKEAVSIPGDAVATWIIADPATGTNYLSAVATSQTSNSVTFHLPLGGAALPAGVDEWVSFVSLLQGTNFLGVIDRTRAECLWSPYTSAAALTPTNPLPELLRQFATTSYVADAVAPLSASVSALEAWGGSLYADCAGGFRWPDYFTVSGVEAGVLPGAVTNTFSSTQSVYNVTLETGTTEVLKGWQIFPNIIRQSDWASGVQWEVIARTNSIPPADLEVDGDVVRFADGVEDFSGDSARVRGTLGEYMVELDLLVYETKQAAYSTAYRFLEPAAGSLLASCWTNVIGTASNGAAAGKDWQLRTWPDGTGGGLYHPAAGWNTNFWGASLGDFSCVSYHTEKAGGAPGGIYMPLTMVTPRHAVCANHWKPGVGSNVWWVSRSGAVLTNRVTAYANVRGDLAVARLDHAFDTNDIAPAALLASGFRSYLYGSTNYASGLFGVPVLGFDAAERGYVMNWVPDALRKGRIQGAADDTTFHLAAANGREVPFFRTQAVGGDSGSPVFWPVDGHLLLLGCFHTPQSGPLPGKAEIDAAIAAWGDEERTQEYDLGHGGWRNYDAPPGP